MIIKETPEPPFHNSLPIPFDPETDVTSPEVFEIERYVQLDYDRMVSSVEDAIMDDKRRGHHGVTPKELLVKSNPGLYAEVTSNPRHMHNMLSSRKWAEDSKDDSHVKHVSSLLVPGPSFPFMSRTSSMNNINNFGGKMLRKHHSQSNQDLSAIDRRDKYSGVHRSLNISMEDLRKFTSRSFEKNG